MFFSVCSHPLICSFCTLLYHWPDYLIFPFPLYFSPIISLSAPVFLTLSHFLTCFPSPSFTSITNEAGASIYSVSPEAVKEMPDMDPNLRSAGMPFVQSYQSNILSDIFGGCSNGPFSIVEVLVLLKTLFYLTAPNDYFNYQ